MANGKKKTVGRSSTSKPDLYEQTTQKIIALMESGKLPWQQGWDNNVGAALVCPINGKSRHRYSRINSVYLSFIMAEKESNDPRFFTMGMLNAQNRIFRERVAALKEQGDPVNPELEWQYGVRKGAKSVLIQMSWKQTHDKNGNPLPEDEQYWAKRFCNVFHASDCVRREYLRDADGNPILDADGKCTYKEHPLKPYVPKERGYTHEEQYEIAEGILKASGAVIKHDVPAAKPHPCYSPSTDDIHLPPKEAFPNLGEYYATALHELAHWTSHKDRLDRNLIGEYASPEYAKEELRAELASAYLALDFGLPMNPTNHAAYVQSWVKDLKEDKMEIFRASAEARKIADYIKGFMPERFRMEDLTVANEDVIIDSAEDKVPEEKEASTDVPALDNTLPIPVTDTSALTLPPEALARGTARFYKYLLTERPADAGAIPKEHLYLVDPDDTAARYGAAYYEKQLPASVAAAYEMTPDYNYFANKSMHVTIYQRREAGAPTPPPPAATPARDAHGDTLAILQEVGRDLTGVLHCYSGSLETARELWKMGYYIGIDGPLTFKNAAKLPDIVREAPRAPRCSAWTSIRSYWSRGTEVRTSSACSPARETTMRSRNRCSRSSTNRRGSCPDWTTLSTTANRLAPSRAATASTASSRREASVKPRRVIAWS